MTDLHKKYLECAGTYLNEEQLKSFKYTLDQQMTGFQMGRSLFLQKK